MNSEKTPFIRIAKRGELLPAKKIWAIRLLAFLFALFIGFMIFLFLGANPVSAYATIVSSSLFKATGRRQVIKAMVPLLGTALALAPCFKMKYWNIGAEGQITIGAMAATYFGLFWADRLPSAVLLIVMGLASVIAGGIWAAIPGVFKARWGTNETLFTLMLNYIGIAIVAWLQGGPWEGRPGSQLIPQFNKKAMLPSVLGIHCGWIIVLVLVVVMFVYMKYTKHGYEIAVLGESTNTARYAGMSVAKITVRTAFLSGAICGLVGFMLASGTNGALNSSIANGAGFTAITVCWLAQLNPFAMVAISFLLAMLSRGSSALYTKMAIPSSISDIITGIILMCLLGCEFFINYRVLFRHSDKEAGHAKHDN